jgi:succinate dehydrogenase/fumarate reductase flavoprotein subunit
LGIVFMTTTLVLAVSFPQPTSWQYHSESCSHWPPPASPHCWDGRVIAGLYTAGETMGIYHRVYAGSTSLLRGLVLGRRAGQHAASQHAM